MKTRIFLEGEDLLGFIEEHINFCHSCVGRNLGGMGQDSPIKGVLTTGINPEGQELQESGLLHSSQGQIQKTHPLSQGREPQKPSLEDGDMLVITSKIVALAESRTFFAHTPEEKLEYVKSEGIYLGETKHVHLSLVEGMYVANAGIDESNAGGKCILLPKDSYESARNIWNKFRAKFQIKNLGIIITDSRTMPLRVGTTGVSLGHAGFEGIRDYVGKLDIFGRPFHYARTNVPDALATAAVHMMGEGDECQPLAVIKNPHVTYTDVRQSGEDLIIDPEDDMYGPLFQI